MIRYDMIWYDTIRYDTIWYDMIWYDMIIDILYNIYIHDGTEIQFSLKLVFEVVNSGSMWKDWYLPPIEWLKKTETISCVWVWFIQYPSLTIINRPCPLIRLPMKSYSLCSDSKVWLPDRHAQYAEEQTMECMCVCVTVCVSCMWVAFFFRSRFRDVYIYCIHTLDTMYIYT